MIDLNKEFKLGRISFINFINLNKTEREMIRKWRNHKDIRKWMYSDRIISSRQHAYFIQSLKKDKKNFYWLVKNKESEYLGVVYLNRLDYINRNAHLGIYVNPFSHLHHCGSILMSSLLKLALKKLRLHKLMLEVIESNKRARSFYKKFCFVEEGRLREMVKRQNKWQDIFVMSIKSAKLNR